LDNLLTEYQGYEDCNALSQKQALVSFLNTSLGLHANVLPETTVFYFVYFEEAVLRNNAAGNFYTNQKEVTTHD